LKEKLFQLLPITSMSSDNL